MSRQDSRKIEDVKVMLVKGADGSSIASIEKTSTSGLVDTYTITLTDGSSDSSFDVTNGNGIVSVEKTGTQGLVDTYTITFDDGTTTTFTVTNGSGGSVDIVDNLNSTDATKVLSANQGHVLKGMVDDAQGNLATIEPTSTASQPYAVGEFLVYNGKLYKVTQAIAQNDTLTVGTNIDFDTVGSELTQINENLSKHYSTSEVDTGDKWVDNKPIYSKTFYAKGQSITSSIMLDETLTNAYVDFVVDIRGTYRNINSNIIYQLPSVDTSSGIRYSVQATFLTNGLQLEVSNVTVKDYAITLYYTKA